MNEAVNAKINVYDAKALGVTNREIVGVKELKRRLGHRFNQEQRDRDITYLKFLRGRNGNITKAVHMLKATLDLRDKMDADNIHLYNPPEVAKQFFPGGIIGFAKSGSPAYYAPFGNLDIKAGFKCIKKIDILRSVLQKMTKMTDLWPAQSEKLQRDIYQLVTIFDFENFSLAQVTNAAALELALLLISLYDANFPETLEVCLVINVSPYVMSMYSIIKPLLSERTLRKIKFFGKSGYQEECLRVFDEDILPAFLGGNRYDPPGDPRCSAFINPSGPIHHSFYLRSPERRLCNQQNVIKLLVPRGSKESVTLEVSDPDSWIRWEFETEKGDIAFGICSLPYYSDDPPITKLDDLERLESDAGAENGMHHCEKAGKCRLMFDNSYSWFKDKEVYYRIQIVKPNGETYFVTK